MRETLRAFASVGAPTAKDDWKPYVAKRRARHRSVANREGDPEELDRPLRSVSRSWIRSCCSPFEMRWPTELSRDVRDLLHAFSSASVEFVVVGAHVIRVRGRPRTTSVSGAPSRFPERRRTIWHSRI